MHIQILISKQSNSRDLRAPSVTLFNKVGWIPFYEQSKLNKSATFYQRVDGSLPIELSQ